MADRPLTLALVGNPNGGKTTLFNRLTGMRQRVANWPGVTVEKKTGAFRLGGLRGAAVDLPGVYALAPLDAAEDERIARHYLAAREADAVINIVDASNLERDLYVTVQLLEQGHPVVVALDMMDVARANGVEIDVAGLSARLGCPVIPMVAAEAQAVATGTFRAMVERFDGKAGAFAYLLFTLLYFPCFAAMGAIYREVGAGWSAFAGFWTTGVAFGAATLFYQAATWSRSPETAALTVGLVLAAFGATIAGMRSVATRAAGRPPALRPTARG